MKTREFLETFATVEELFPQLVLVPMSSNLIDIDVVHIDLEDIAYVLGVKEGGVTADRYYMPTVAELKRFSCPKKMLLIYAIRNMLENNSVFLVPIDECIGVPVYLPMYIAGYTDSKEALPFSSLILLDDRALKNIAETISKNHGNRESFYILPSSKHEVIILPMDFGTNISEDALLEMVVNTNFMLPEEEKLTNSVYFYDADLQMVKKIR